MCRLSVCVADRWLLNCAFFPCERLHCALPFISHRIEFLFWSSSPIVIFAVYGASFLCVILTGGQAFLQTTGLHASTCAGDAGSTVIQSPGSPKQATSIAATDEDTAAPAAVTSGLGHQASTMGAFANPDDAFDLLGGNLSPIEASTLAEVTNCNNLLHWNVVDQSCVVQQASPGARTKHAPCFNRRC